jgi:hypothetical protein
MGEVLITSTVWTCLYLVCLFVAYMLFVYVMRQILARLPNVTGDWTWVVNIIFGLIAFLIVVRWLFGLARIAT